jgi:hypothetical protein
VEKPIRFTAHARERLLNRGGTPEEVARAIREAPWKPEREGRWSATLEVPFSGVWNGRRYNAKQVRPVFVVEEEAIVVVTVYVYFLPEGGLKEDA